MKAAGMHSRTTSHTQRQTAADSQVRSLSCSQRRTILVGSARLQGEMGPADLWTWRRQEQAAPRLGKCTS